MKKTYFLIKPSEFKRLGNIDIDGKVEEIQCEDFKVKNQKENVLVFEAYYEDAFNSTQRDFEFTATEFVSGKKFDLEVFYKEDDSVHLNLHSDELGLYMENSINILDAEVSALKVSGLLMHLKNHESENQIYYNSLFEMLDTARAFKHIYDNNVDGPSEYVAREVRKGYKKSLK